MNKFLLIAIACLILLKANSIRFADDAQMKKHHDHLTPTLLDGENQPILTVHMIPHTHDDVGWLKTVDQYFWGDRKDIQFASVQYIIDSVINELQKDPTKRFIYVEMAFFKRWYRQQTDETKKIVKQLVINKQLEFINGGWCMNDEAAAYYEDIIDQMTTGHRFIKQNFGVFPRIGWHIDPFGHSNSQAKLFSQMGFQAFFFARIDHQDKDLRMDQKTLEMIWQPYSASKTDNSIFTHVNYYHYSSPPSFNFDVTSNDAPIMDDLTLDGYNIDQRAIDLANYFKNQALHYKASHLLHTFGEDFQWTDAQIFYKNLDKLIKYVNARSDQLGVKLQYSTPSEYIDAINQLNITYPEKNDDFMPYSDDEHSFWTGYYVSRVSLKGLVKQVGRGMQLVRNYLSQLYISRQSNYLQNNFQDFMEALENIEESLGICQHHDAVAGTAKQAVTDDYVKILSNGWSQLLNFYATVVKEQTNSSWSSLSYCFWNTTASNCNGLYNNLKANSPVEVVVLSPKANEIIQLKVPNLNYTVSTTNGTAIPGEMACLNPADKDDCDLFFTLDLNSQVTTSVIIQQSTTPSVTVLTPQNNLMASIQSRILKEKKSTILTSGNLNDLTFKFCNKFDQECTEQSITLEYRYYNSYAGSGQQSGAYIFRPNDQESHIYSAINNKVSFAGKLVNILQLQGNGIYTNLFMFSNTDLIQMETFIDGIQAQNQGKELILSIQTALQTGNKFQTDSNGLELQNRTLNYRPTWNLTLHEPIAGNYFPINAMIVVSDEKGQSVAVFNDRSQGGSSLKSGNIEIMVHRRMFEDDSRGVGEPLNEKEPDGNPLKQKFRHWILFFNQNDGESLHRVAQVSIDKKPVVAFGASNGQVSQTAQQPGVRFEQDPLVKEYLRVLDEGSFLYRVQNLHEFNSKTIAVDSSKFTRSVTIIEYTMTGSQPLADFQREKLKWNVTGNPKPEFSYENHNDSIGQFEILPLEIRTFLVTFN